MGHRRHETALQPDALVGLRGDGLQLPAGLLEPGVIDDDAHPAVTVLLQAAVAVCQEEGEHLLLVLDIGLDGLHLLVVQMAVVVAVALVGDVERGDEVVAYLAIAVEQRQDVELDVAVDAHLGVLHVLADEHVVAAVGRVDVAEQRDVEHADGLPEPLVLGVIVGHAAELPHVVVEVDEPAVLVVERHGDERDVRQLLVLLDEFALGLVLLDVVGDVVDGVDDVGGMSLVVELQDGMAVEVEPVGGVVGGAVEQLVQHELSLASVGQALHLLGELLLLAGVDVVGEFGQCQAFLGQYLAVPVGHTVVLDVIDHDDEVAHVEGLEHHAVQLRGFAGGAPHVGLRQSREEIAEGRQQQHGGDDVIDHRRRMVVDALGMEPAVLDGCNLAALLQARVLVVYLLDQLAVAADDMDLGDGDAHVVEHDALEVELLDLPLQRLLAPHVVFVVAVEHAHQRHLGRLELHAAVAHRVAVHEVEGGVVAGLEDSTIVLQLIKRHHADGVGVHGHTDAIVVDDIIREDIGFATVAAGISQDDVGIAALKGL